MTKVFFGAVPRCLARSFVVLPIRHHQHLIVIVKRSRHEFRGGGSRHDGD
jgi:hypothetical protein